MRSLIPAIIFLAFIFCSCSKSWDFPDEPIYINPMQPGLNIPISNNPTGQPASSSADSSILIDASKDGGVWWYPQSGTYSSSQWHQGTALADLMRSRGFTVRELGRGTRVTWDLLRNYKYVIRATAFFNYEADELAAYDSFLNRSSSLLLINDHLQNSPNDALSARLGLHFTGSVTGVIDAISNHAITNGVTTIPYIAGSVITQPHLDITALGNVNGTAVAMGIRNHPTSKIFFIGDGNGLQQLPQPFTGNLFKWLFNL